MIIFQLHCFKFIFLSLCIIIFCFWCLGYEFMYFYVVRFLIYILIYVSLYFVLRIWSYNLYHVLFYEYEIHNILKCWCPSLWSSSCLLFAFDYHTAKKNPKLGYSRRLSLIGFGNCNLSLFDLINDINSMGD